MQHELCGCIARAIENLKKSSGKLTLGMVETRLQALEANWAKFESNHDKLVITMAPEAMAASEYARQSLAALTEDAYLVQKGQFLDLMRELRVKEKAQSTITAEAAPASVTSPSALIPLCLVSSCCTSRANTRIGHPFGTCSTPSSVETRQHLK